ncbi:Arc family DNA-binding protein [Pseudomonas sp. BC42]|uniref:Arc family DNA-binding protein n=1 Tax=Pseudomonas sp. BC42 TaxID=2933816 RepID=UPI001F3DDD3B|nr:Arc family DNA-binding protein [Pseudomonas sp. BC42]ULT73042.1 Arc family DNA-binding protein [Pseudomonas sp. BC42]
MSDRHAISPYPVRMPNELRQRLDDSARQGSRSLHAEIISRLEESFTPPHLKQMGMGELTDALIEMGQEKGISVEVIFNYGADDKDQSETVPMPFTTSINKQALIQNTDEAHRSAIEGQDHEEMSAAINRAYEALRALDVMVGNTATPKGPQPRKRYPKK